MRQNLFAGMLLMAVVAGGAHAAEDPALEHAKRLLSRAILFDGHNDLPWAIRTNEKAPRDVARYDLRQRTAGHTDIPRLREGRVGAQFWSVYIPGEAAGIGLARTQLEQISLAHEIIDRYPETFQLARTAADVRAAHKAGRIASMLGMEGGYGLENSLGVLRAYYELGVRYMALTHNTHTSWADSATEFPARHGGLTSFGEDVVREMNRLGMLVDLSHASEETMHDVLRVTRAPVIFSHSAAKAVCDVPRNVPDEVLRALPANGGVIMVAFVAGFIAEEVAERLTPAIERYVQRSRLAKSDAERLQIRQEEIDSLELPVVTIAQVADHIDHIRKVAGVDHVGIGSDYDGAEAWPEGLDDVSSYPRLFAELIRRGWSDSDLEKLAGGNILRVLERAERVSKQMQGEPPAIATIAR